ncbi:NAD-P-binding protein [Sparassis latifolia]
MTILITGAAGRTSGYVIRAILQVTSFSESHIRLLVHSQDTIQELRAHYPQLPPSAIVTGDYLEASTLPPVFEGVDVVFYNAPAFHPQETAMGIAVIDAAKAAGVKHFVYCSVLFPILTKLLNHKVKCRVEEYLIESRLNYTILEPTHFMQNVDLKHVQETGLLPAEYSPDVLQGYLDLPDLAAVARTILLDPAPHNRARYELVGQNCTFEDVAKEISKHTGKKIICAPIAREAIVSTVKYGQYAQEALDRMLYYYDTRGIPGNNNVLRWLLGHEPTTWGALLRRDLKHNV